MKDKIRKYANSLNIRNFGVCSTDDGCQALVFLFPYYAGNSRGTISFYARGEDYHKVVRKYLLLISEYIHKLSGISFSDKIYCDISPYNDKDLAFRAGLGFYGKNSLLINPTLGSYFFIGYIITSGLNLPEDHPLEISCLGCGKCEKACPGKAIKETGFIKELCASEISQKKGELSLNETNILKSSGYTWGCDICQVVCPHNENLPVTPLPEFSQGLVFHLPEEEILNKLSEKEFKKEYDLRAFSWRGKKVLLRNIALTKTEE